MLQCVAVCCSVLRRVAVCCSVLRRVAARCSAGRKSSPSLSDNAVNISPMTKMIFDNKNVCCIVLQNALQCVAVSTNNNDLQEQKHDL